MYDGRVLALPTGIEPEALVGATAIVIDLLRATTTICFALAAGARERSARGTPPLRDAAEALDLGELVDAWDECARRLDAGLARLTAEAVDRPALSHPGASPGETVRSLLSGILFHQAYHAGQLGTLRRFVGKEGAIP